MCLNFDSINRNISTSKLVFNLILIFIFCRIRFFFQKTKRRLSTTTSTATFSTFFLTIFTLLFQRLFGGILGEFYFGHVLCSHCSGLKRIDSVPIKYAFVSACEHRYSEIDTAIYKSTTVEYCGIRVTS